MVIIAKDLNTSNKVSCYMMLNKVEKTSNIDNNETIAITLRLPKILIEEIDLLIIEKGFRNRQDVFSEILREKLKEKGNKKWNHLSQS